MNTNHTYIINDEHLQESFEQTALLLDIPTDALSSQSMSELMTTRFYEKPALIEGLLYPGTYLLAGTPKIGKSFLVMQIAYHISTGTSLWGRDVHKGTTLYLALEDTSQRLQFRLSKMFASNVSDDFHFAIQAKGLGCGLEEQLTSVLQIHPDTKLIVVDTLQKIRDGNGSYRSDYEIISRIKTFADQNGLCFLLVHHLRKQKSRDNFEMISGSTGLLGAADGALLLKKEERISGTAVLEVTGRDEPLICWRFWVLT